VQAVAFVVSCIFSAHAFTAVIDRDIDRIVGGEMHRQHIPGMALMVSQHGMVVRSQGYGLANVELDVPVKPATVFQSGSMGKQFAATAVMMLVEAGKIRLEDPLIKYFPGGPPWWGEATIRELLSHTAGFADYPKEMDMRRDYTEDEILTIAEKLPPAYAPGTSWIYSNLGYATIGILIHRVTGQFYGDFLQAKIFKPLGMSTTRIISESDIIPNRAAGYHLVNGELKNQEWVAPSLNTSADGSLYFTILDLAKWDAALYDDRLLKASSLRTMWTVAALRDGKPNAAGYGFGWFVRARQGRRVIEHSGEWQGFRTQISRYLDDALTVVVLTNLSGADPQLIADRVARQYLERTAK
jgi:CubicO group peptidase (beta-lactamase class C family)